MKAKLLAVVLAAFCSQAMAQEAAHWSYEGEAAPQNWSKLNPEFMLCEKGKNQSPVDIHGALQTHSQPLNIDYKLAPESVINNGHSIQVDVKEGDVLTLDGERFVLQQFISMRQAKIPLMVNPSRWKPTLCIWMRPVKSQ